MKNKTSQTDLSEILPEDLEKDVKEAAEISMGTEITDTDEKYIHMLCTQVIQLSNYRVSLSEYLKNRMIAISPNLTAMVGELVGARLIAHAGSLMNLAKYPASTIQILGAEKALFKAIRTKHNTPKYGLIYQASIVGKCPNEIKGKISRSLSAKCALCVRVDALGENENAEVGTESREYIEKRVSFLQNVKPGDLKQKKINKEQFTKKQENVATYNPKNDIVFQQVPKLETTFRKSSKTLQQISEKDKKKKVEKVEKVEKVKEEIEDEDDDAEEINEIEEKDFKKKKVKKI